MKYLNNQKAKELADTFNCKIGEIYYWLFFLQQKGCLDSGLQLVSSYDNVLDLVRNVYENK